MVRIVRTLILFSYGDYDQDNTVAAVVNYGRRVASRASGNNRRTSMFAIAFATCQVPFRALLVAA